jgi:multidrug resistance efflux pump
MTAQPKPASSSPYRVTPPRTAAEPIPPNPNNSDEASPSESAQPESVKPNHRPWIIGGVLAGLGLMGLIPVPYQVGGDVQLAWRTDARQAVNPPMPAMVERVLVSPGDRVGSGQPLVQLSSRELEREIAEVQEKLAQAQRELALAQQEQIQAEALVFEASVREQVARQQAQPSLERMQQIQQGLTPPEIQQLQIEQVRLEQQLQEISTNIDRFQLLADEGAIAQMRVDEQESLYRNVERDLAVNAQQHQLVQQQIETAAIQDLGTIDTQSASLSAAQQVMETNQRIAAQEQIIVDLNQRLATLQTEQDTLVLTATTDGTVITSDLDLLVGQEVRPETTLMQVAELSQLTANVEIKEEDLTFVEIGATVTFRPRQSKLDTYSARVEDILYNLESDETQQQQVATVRVVIENPDEQLRPGSSGYAKIFSEWTPLYSRVGRELLKLIPERFLFG